MAAADLEHDHTQMTRYTPLITLGRAQAHLAESWKRTGSLLALVAWVPLRALFLLGYWLSVPKELRA